MRWNSCWQSILIQKKNITGSHMDRSNILPTTLWIREGKSISIGIFYPLSIFAVAKFKQASNSMKHQKGTLTVQQASDPPKLSMPYVRLCRKKQSAGKSLPKHYLYLLYIINEIWSDSKNILKHYQHTFDHH